MSALPRRPIPPRQPGAPARSFWTALPRTLSRVVFLMIPGIVSRNWRLKVAAVALALVLWALVRADPSRRSDVFDVPVRAQVTDPRWTLSADPDPGTVQVRLRGPTGELIRLAREGAVITIPLDSISGADTLVQVRRDWVELARGSGLIVEDVSPASVRLRLEPTLSTLVPVRVVTRGELPEGMALAAPVGLSPQLVRIRGAGRRVRAIDSVALAPLDLDDVRGSGVYTVDVDTAGLGVQIFPLTASLAIRLEPTTERELTAVPVVAMPEDGERFADSLVMVPPTIPVHLAGARTPVAGTDSAAVRAVVPWADVVGLGPGQERRVPIHLHGLPALVRATAAVDSVTVRRLAPPLRGLQSALPR